MKRKENVQLLPKELHQLKYEALSVQGSVRLVKKTQERKSSTCYLLITKGVTSSSPVPLKTHHSVAIEVSSQRKLTGIVRGEAFLHVFADARYVAQTNANVPNNVRCDGYDR
ncbi:hypothetical protein TNCV_1446251 [Trichonephila clavipes]|nr:hypothetical protein TNCV_1446251 [Trichonephila clavipes]